MHTTHTIYTTHTHIHTIHTTHIHIHTIHTTHTHILPLDTPYTHTVYILDTHYKLTHFKNIVILYHSVTNNISVVQFKKQKKTTACPLCFPVPTPTPPHFIFYTSFFFLSATIMKERYLCGSCCTVNKTKFGIESPRR